MPWIAANGIDLYHEIGGRGAPLMFISGTGGDLRLRPNVFDSVLVQSAQLLAYDQRGLGRTRAPDGVYSMADYADDAAALLDALGWPAVPVLGVSFGGMVAQELTLRHPERVTRLVLACTSAGGACGASFPLHELENLDDDARIERSIELADVRRDAAWREANPETWSRLVAYARGSRHADRDVDGAARQLEARRHHDTCARLSSIEVPVLIAAGRYDGIARPENQRAMAERIPDCRLEFFDGGHLFLIQDRTAYPAIAEWLGL